MNLRVMIEPHAPDTLQAVVRDGVALHNVATTGAADYYPGCILLKNEHDEVLGGILGHIWARCMHIAFVWIAPTSPQTIKSISSRRH